MKRSIIPLHTLALLLLLAGCSLLDDNDAADTPKESTVVVAQEGQHIALPAFDATLTFVEKTEESRCPTNVTCAWEGRAKILLEIARSGQAPASFEMVGLVGPDGNGTIRHEAVGLRFTLERLDHY